MKQKVWRALTGLDYRHTDTGQLVRVEKGEKAEGLDITAQKSELAAGNIEEWTEEESGEK